MSEWWYHCIHKCPDCGATYDEYLPDGSAYDSGFSSSPVVRERCPECEAEFVRPELLQEALEMLQSAKKYLSAEWYPDWSVVAPLQILNDAQIAIEKELQAVRA